MIQDFQQKQNNKKASKWDFCGDGRFCILTVSMSISWLGYCTIGLQAVTIGGSG